MLESESESKLPGIGINRKVESIPKLLNNLAEQRFGVGKLLDYGLQPNLQITLFGKTVFNHVNEHTVPQN